MKRIFNNKKTASVAIAGAVALTLMGSMAYFTDYATTQANGTAGTVALSMDSNINLLDAEGRDIINPGDMRDGSFTVTNEGNKSVDVRTTIVLTTQSNTGFDLAFSGDANTQSEYDLYLRDDVELVEGYGYMPKEGAKPLQVKSIDQDTITYILPEYSLNGNSDRYNEVETIDGVTEFAHTNDFVFVMKGGAGNNWQNSSVSIDVLVEAKQHENTQSGWDIVATENITSGAINKDAVKGENVITDIDGTYNGIITFSLIDDDADAGIPNVTMTLVKLPDSGVSTVDTLGGTVIKTVRSDANGEGEFGRLEEGAYALVSPNFQLTEEAKDLLIVGKDGRDHYEWRGSMDWAKTIEGTVTDQNGDPVADAEVSIYDEDDDFVAGDITDENGDYTIYPVDKGEYEMDIIKIGCNLTVIESQPIEVTPDMVQPLPVNPSVKIEEEPEEPSEAPEGVVVAVNYVYEPDATDPLYSENIDDNVSDIIAQLVADHPEIEEHVPAAAWHKTHGYGQWMYQGVMVANVVADVCPYQVTDSDPFSATNTYEWTSYEVVSDTAEALTVKFICDEIDFSKMAIAFECECGPGLAHGNVVIEDTKLTWTETFDKTWKNVEFSVVDMNGEPVANARIHSYFEKPWDDPWGDCQCTGGPTIETDENGKAVITGDNHTLPNGTYTFLKSVPNISVQTSPLFVDELGGTESFVINDSESVTIQMNTPPVVHFTLVDRNGNAITDETAYMRIANPENPSRTIQFNMNNLQNGKISVKANAETYTIKDVQGSFGQGNFSIQTLAFGNVSSGVTVNGDSITMAGSAEYEVELVVGKANNVTLHIQDGTGSGNPMIDTELEITGPNGYSETVNVGDGFGEISYEMGTMAAGLYNYTLTTHPGYECDYRMVYQTTGTFNVTGVAEQTVNIYENFDNPVGWQAADEYKFTTVDSVNVMSMAEEGSTVYGVLPVGTEVYVSAVLDNGYSQISLHDASVPPYINNNEYGMSIGYVLTSALGDSF